MRNGGWFWLAAGGGITGVAFLLLRGKNANAATAETAPATTEGAAGVAPGEAAPAPTAAPMQPAPTRSHAPDQPAPSRPAASSPVPRRPAPRPADDGPAFESIDERTALARVIRSEAGSQTPAERRAIAWVARNRARKHGTSIARMVCYPTCGRQGKARPMSSRVAPRPSELALADEVLAASPAEDPTGGATNAFEPKLQDQLVREGRPGYHKTAAEVRRDWLRSSDAYGAVGRWELFGPKGGGRAHPATGPQRVPEARRAPGPPAPARRPQLKYAQERLPDNRKFDTGRPTPPKGWA